MIPLPAKGDKDGWWALWLGITAGLLFIAVILLIF